MKLDPSSVRPFFPGLESDWIYMDNAGGSQIARPVVDRVQSYLLESNVQHGASYEPSRLATARVAAGVQAVADFMGCAHDEVVLGPSTSMLLKNLARSIESEFVPGDEIVVSRCDHEANVGPWVDLEKKGVKIVFWDPNPETLELRSEDLDPLLTRRTKLVAFTHCSNLIGTIHDVQAVTHRVRSHGAMTCIDGVAYAPHRCLDVEAWGADFYVFSLYKTYGPHCAALYGRRDLLHRLPGINHFFLEEEVPYKFQPGNVNYELTYGLTGIWDYIDAMTRGPQTTDEPRTTDDPNKALSHEGGAVALTSSRRSRLASFYDSVSLYEESLVEPLLALLRKDSRITILGNPDASRNARVPTVSFRVSDLDSRSFVEQMDEFKIGIRWGDFYARRLVDKLELDATGVIRVSLVHYNTAQEVEQLLEAMESVLQ